MKPMHKKYYNNQNTSPLKKMIPGDESFTQIKEKECYCLSFEINIIDIIDVLLVGILFYQLYRMLKGTAALNIFLGFIIFLYTMENCGSFAWNYCRNYSGSC